MLADVDGYSVLKTFHVLFAILWVGGAATVNILGTRAVASGEGTRLALFGRDTEWLGTRVYLPMSILVLVFGIFTVLAGPWSFTDAWVVIGVLGIVATAVTGSTYLGPEVKRITRIIEQRGHDDPEAKRRMRRLVAVARIDLVVLILVVADMVIKPGA